jgi:hypothetical protein
MRPEDSEPKSTFYKLVDKVPVECTIEEVILMGEEINQRVDKTIIGETTISTVFLGIDVSFGLTGKPFLFETMIRWATKRYTDAVLQLG